MRYQLLTTALAAGSLSFALPATAYAQSTSYALPPVAVAPAPGATFALPSTAYAQSFQAQRTRSAALKYEIAYLALSAVDTIQTVECIERGRCEEANPLFRKHPRMGRLIAAKVVGGALHFTAFKYISEHSPKGALRFAQGSLLVQGGVVALNARFMF